MNRSTLSLAVLALFSPITAADQLSLAPSADATLYESSAGELANGAGQSMFAGRNGAGDLRRALVRFDVAGALPAGSVVHSVELQLSMSKSSFPGPTEHALRRVLADWGEGTVHAPGGEGAGAPATSGDATWLFRHFDTQSWTTPGGELAPAASASTPISAAGLYTWSSTPTLVADVQLWLDHPELAHGWALVGDESGASSTRRFDTREHPSAAARPELVIDFTPPACGLALAAQESARLGVPANPSALLGSSGGAPLLGGSWKPRVDHSNFAPTAVLDLLAVSTASANVASPAGTVLVDLNAFTVWAVATPGQAFDLRVPSDCSQLGMNYFAQAASLMGSSGYALTNALDVVIGSVQ